MSTDANALECRKAWRVYLGRRLRDLESDVPSWPTRLEVFTAGFEAGASRKVEVTDEQDTGTRSDNASDEAVRRYSSRLIEDHDGDRYGEDEYGYDATARQAFVAGASWQASRKVEVTDTLTDDVLAMLDDLNESNGIAYDDYVRLHDAISRKVEVTDEQAIERTARLMAYVTPLGADAVASALTLIKAQSKMLSKGGSE